MYFKGKNKLIGIFSPFVLYSRAKSSNVLMKKYGFNFLSTNIHGAFQTKLITAENTLCPDIVKLFSKNFLFTWFKYYITQFWFYDRPFKDYMYKYICMPFSLYYLLDQTALLLFENLAVFLNTLRILSDTHNFVRYE